MGPFYFLTRHLVFLGLRHRAGRAGAMRTELQDGSRSTQPVAAAGVLRAAAAGVRAGSGHAASTARGAGSTSALSRFQAVEAVKLILIVWLSSYLVRYRDEVQATAGSAMLKPLLVAGALVVLLLLAAGLRLGDADAGGHRRHGLARRRATCRACCDAGGAGDCRCSRASRSLEPYRVRRLTSFMDPWADPFDGGYQLTSALMAIGRGEWFGVGLGGSVQKLDYLPEAHTDFIFAVIAEELGFVGVCLVIGLYGCWSGAACIWACAAWRCGQPSPATARSASRC